MVRLSRARIWPIVLALIVFAGMETLAIYVFVLNRRLTRDLVDHTWREPTIIRSSRHVVVTTLYGVDWRVTRPITLASLPAYVPDAFLAAEDVRFRHHFGIDPIGMARALITDLRAGAIEQGGSTIDQQIVRARFLSQERTWRRKFVEIVLAILLDARMSKDEILEIYLNDVYLGNNGGKPVLGIDEASRLYLDELPSDLRVDQAAMLAGMIRAPNRDNPWRRPDVVRIRRDAVLRVMRNHGWITSEQYRDAVSRDVGFTPGSIPQAPFPYYLRALRSELVNEVGVQPVIEGGLTIDCAIEPAAQRAAERVARRVPARLEARHPWIRSEARREPPEVAILSVDPRDGGVRALVGGIDYGYSPFDRTSAMRRQPGSAFKTFAYLDALASKRATPATLLLDEPVTVDVPGGQAWEPHDYDERYRGRVTLRQAFEDSLNVPTVRLTQQIGVDGVVRTAEKFGFEENFAPVPALPLGVVEVTVRELTAAYTPFPNLGVRVEPFLVADVYDHAGNTLYEHKPEMRRVTSAAAAYVMHTLLRGVVERGTASHLRQWGLGYVAGKTGTTNDYRDAWFVGYTPDMVSTVWVGFDHGAPLRMSSAEAAIPIWGAYMSAIPHSHAEPAPPRGVVFRDIDPDSGMLWRDGCPGPWREVFLEGTEPTRYCPRGLIGAIYRRFFLNREHFEEPPAITYDTFRRWAGELRRIFGH